MDFYVVYNLCYFKWCSINILIYLSFLDCQIRMHILTSEMLLICISLFKSHSFCPVNYPCIYILKIFFVCYTYTQIYIYKYIFFAFFQFNFFFICDISPKDKQNICAANKTIYTGKHRLQKYKETKIQPMIFL